MSSRPEVVAECREALQESGRITKASVSGSLALVLGFLGFSGKILYDNYRRTPAEIAASARAKAEADAAAQAQAAANNCPRLDTGELERRKQAIIDAAHTIPTTISWTANETRLLRIGGANRLRFVDTNPFIDQISKEDDIQNVAGIADIVTTEYFGFRTTATIDPRNPEQTRTDALQLMHTLDTTPMDLTQAVGLDEVQLGNPEPAKIKASAFTRRTTSDNEERVITIGPGQVGGFNHELGHWVQWEYTAKTCGSPHIPGNIDPDFTRVNPATFAYQYPAKNWKGVTRDWYPATRLEEDEADSYEALMTPDSGCKAARSPIIAHKIGVVSMHLDALSPYAGTYSVDAFTHYCTTNVAR